MIIEAPADAFVNVSPPGKTETLGDVDRRTVPLDRPGSIETTEVTGDLAHPWLAFEGLNWLVGLSQRRVIRVVIGLVAATVVALVKDKLKVVLKAHRHPEEASRSAGVIRTTDRRCPSSSP